MESEWSAPDNFQALTPEVLDQANENFDSADFSRDERIQCLLAIAQVKDTQLARSAEKMKEIIDKAVINGDFWVKGLARLLEQFPTTAMIQCAGADQKYVYQLSEEPELKLEVKSNMLTPLEAELHHSKAEAASSSPARTDFKIKKESSHAWIHKETAELMAQPMSGDEEEVTRTSRTSARPRTDFLRSWRDVEMSQLRPKPKVDLTDASARPWTAPRGRGRDADISETSKRAATAGDKASARPTKLARAAAEPLIRPASPLIQNEVEEVHEFANAEHADRAADPRPSGLPVPKGLPSAFGLLP